MDSTPIRFPIPIGGTSFTVTCAESGEPTAWVRALSEGQFRVLKLTNPDPISVLLGLFDNSYDIWLIDRGAPGANQPTRGRYRLEIRDAKDLCAEAVVDDYEIILDD